MNRVAYIAASGFCVGFIFVTSVALGAVIFSNAGFPGMVAWFAFSSTAITFSVLIAYDYGKAGKPKPSMLTRHETDIRVWFFIPAGWPLEPGFPSMHNPLEPYLTESDAISVQAYYGAGKVISCPVRIASSISGGLKESTVKSW